MENKTISIIKNRVSCREYTEKKVPMAKVMQIAEAGKMAPSGMNRQIANILVLRKKRLVEKLRKLAIETAGKDAYYGANTMLIVYGPRDDRFTLQDCTCIIENMFIAASALKVNSCWINRTEYLLNSPKGKKLRKELGIDENSMVVGTCILGYAPENAKLAVKERKADFIKVL